MDTPTKPPVVVTPLQRVGRYAAVAVVAALVGFVPPWLTSRARTSERDAAQSMLRRAQVENTLAAAAIRARRGEYEVARTSASTFYTNLRAELDRPDPAFTPAEIAGLQPLLSERDQLIALLARTDPASAERLSDAYLTYLRATGTASSTPAQ